MSIQYLIFIFKGGVQIQSIQLEWTAQYASTADPYLSVVSTCGKALVLALREFKAKDGTVFYLFYFVRDTDGLIW
jgi:hypothetical protein